MRFIIVLLLLAGCVAGCAKEEGLRICEGPPKDALRNCLAEVPTLL